MFYHNRDLFDAQNLPVRHYNTQLGRFNLKLDGKNQKFLMSEVDIRPNHIYLEDDIFQMTQHENLTFVDTDKSLVETYELPPVTGYENVLFTQTLALTNHGTYYHRRIYSVFHAMAFIGGVIYVTHGIFAYLIGPCARHSYKMRAFKRLYFARTKDEKLFESYARNRSSSLQNGQSQFFDTKNQYKEDNWENMGQHHYTSERPSYDQAKLLEQRKVQAETP